MNMLIELVYEKLRDYSRQFKALEIEALRKYANGEDYTADMEAAAMIKAQILECIQMIKANERTN